MAQTRSSAETTVPGAGEFTLNALPDPFDERDLEYRPRLQPLPATLDRSAGSHVLEQQGRSCTGHALATVINTVLAHVDKAPGEPAEPHVSPYMLYTLARRYDELPGEEDAGSSLRGALKGWFHHGVLLEEDWPELDPFPEPDLYSPQVQRKAFRRPSGAYYRVNPLRLDDMQSAISELNAICVSALIHEGWLDVHGPGLPVIERSAGAAPIGGHAFAIVGYDETGFLVQNSWGPGWGEDGFAVLTYDDWLQACYDAWVLRPGVPMALISAIRRPAGPERLATSGLDLPRLAQHVVNLGNDGRLSADGSFTSNPEQIDRIFGHMLDRHERWGGPRHVMVHAHGGMTDEAGGLRVAQANYTWWLNNQVYPLFFAWQSGPFETLLDQLVERFSAPMAASGLRDWLIEQADRAIEQGAGRLFKPMWAEMKENARRASDRLADPHLVTWPVTAASRPSMAGEPGASLVVSRLRKYADDHPQADLRVHLVGHSAGSVFHAALLRRLTESGVRAASMSLLAPAIRVDEFQQDILRPLQNSTVSALTLFALNDRQELDDDCGGIYHKSILYLVSRALENRQPGIPETPLAGMERFLTGPLRTSIESAGGKVVISPAQTPHDFRCGASAHTAFDSDPATMTSVASRIIGDQALEYHQNALPITAGPPEQPDPDPPTRT